MKKIFDSTAFYPQEEINYYFDTKRNLKIEWGEPPTKEELIELFEQWPVGTELGDVFPHCKVCFKYPIIEDNIYLYRLLTTSKDFRGLFDPLDYFNLLYEQLKYCLDRVNIDAQTVIDHLMRLNLTKRKLHFFLFSLHYLIKGLNGSVTADRVWPDGIYTIKNKKLGHIDLDIIDAYQSFEKELGIETENTDLPNVRTGTGSGSILIDTSKPQKRFTQPQIALISIYEKIDITKGNCAEIARRYGFFNPSSGEGLRQDYEHYKSDANRLGSEKTKKKHSNKIELFESVLEYLSDSAKGRIKDEIKSLKNKLADTDW